MEFKIATLKQEIFCGRKLLLADWKRGYKEIM